MFQILIIIIMEMVLFLHPLWFLWYFFGLIDYWAVLPLDNFWDYRFRLEVTKLSYMFFSVNLTILTKKIFRDTLVFVNLHGRSQMTDVSIYFKSLFF